MTGTTLAPLDATAVLSDDALVEDAISAMAEAENAEAEAGSPHRWKTAESYAELSRRGWTQGAIAKRCKVSQQTVSVYVRCATRYLVGEERPTFWHAYAEITGEKQRVHYSSETPEWETPQDLFDALDVEFGFTLDVCATSENAKCERYFTAEDDGLAQTWEGICWMNPPYGDTIDAWVSKARESAAAGATVVCLVPARVDTAWWWDNCWQGEVRFIRGRLKFGGGDTGAPFPSAVVVFGREPNIPSTAQWER